MKWLGLLMAYGSVWRCILQTLLLLIGIFGLADNLRGQSEKLPLARLDHALFLQPDGEVVAEIYIRIPGKSLTYHRIDSLYYQAKALIALSLEHDQKQHYQKQYILKSPKVKDTSQLSLVLTDQRKVPLKRKGKHRLNFTIVDSFQTQNRASVSQTIYNRVEDPERPQFSDIKRLDILFLSNRNSRFSQGPYYMRPKATSRVQPSEEWLYFYAELYNADQLKLSSEEVPVSVSVHQHGDTLYSKQQAFQAKSQVKIATQLQAEKLQKGKHQLLFSVPTSGSAHLTTAFNFTVPYTHPSDSLTLEDKLVEYPTDSLVLFLDWMRATAKPYEAGKMELLEKRLNRDSLISFTVRFWEKRNARNPLHAWENYKEEVAHVNEHYTNPLYKGYESDRGRVYLEYGPPNTIQRSRDDPNTYPYEIWHYFTTQRQSNVRFVFYSSSILETEFILLHSDAIGEIRDPRWQEKLNRSPFQRDDPFGNNPAWDFQK